MRGGYKLIKNNYGRMGVICMVFAFFLSISSAASAATPVAVENEVEFIYESTNPANSLYPSAASSLQWGVDGGRETRPSTSEERVWGWSTCKDGQGTNVYHYTVAQYETIIGGQVRASSGRVWGTGQVWAYSGWVSQDNALVMNAKVYYGV